MSANLEFYDWLIRARTESQSALLRLLRLGTEKRGRFILNVEAHQLFGLLVGAAFSFWRAAFLSNIRRSPQDIHDNALTLLESALETNAILFQQEKKTEEWMGGYYLNSGRFRLEKAALLRTIADELKGSDRPDSVSRVLGLAIGIPAGSLMDTWSDCHSTLLWMLGHLERIVESDVAPNSPMQPTGSARG